MLPFGLKHGIRITGKEIYSRICITYIRHHRAAINSRPFRMHYDMSFILRYRLLLFVSISLYLYDPCIHDNILSPARQACALLVNAMGSCQYVIPFNQNSSTKRGTLWVGYKYLKRSIPKFCFRTVMYS